MAPSRSEAKKLTREKILSISEDLFLESGFQSTTAEIAKAVGVTHGTIVS